MPARRPRRSSDSSANPFAGAGIARLGDDFTDRADERKVLAKALRTPKAHVLLVGPRRIGKTSLLRAVEEDLRRAGHPVIYLDLWSSSTVEDVTTRLAQEAARVLGRSWRELPLAFARRLELTLEPSRLADGTMVPVPSLKLRHAPASQQRQRLVDALDTLDAQARAAGAQLGVMLDEFQLIEVVGRDAADGTAVSAVRQLRAAIQHHTNTTYVLAGSDRTLIDELSDPKHGPLHNLAR
ncbi:MAG: AAA family ATPase, partial [Gemmatimonadaceae bacterium]|nr:AAA family ATPase [Gemmatimonadaceae bacterium]